MKTVRTTVDIPNALYRQLKTRAASEGRSVKELILRGVDHELNGSRKVHSRHKEFPLVPSRRPGTVDLTNAKIFEVIPFP